MRAWRQGRRSCQRDRAAAARGPAALAASTVGAGGQLVQQLLHGHHYDRAAVAASKMFLLQQASQPAPPQGLLRRRNAALVGIRSHAANARWLWQQRLQVTRTHVLALLPVPTAPRPAASNRNNQQACACCQRTGQQQARCSLRAGAVWVQGSVRRCAGQVGQNNEAAHVVRDAVWNGIPRHAGVDDGSARQSGGSASSGELAIHGCHASAASPARTSAAKLTHKLDSWAAKGARHHCSGIDPLTRVPATSLHTCGS